MKAIMISIKPKWCALMMNGDKTVEVRKNKALASAVQKLIDEQGYADIYVYCSKDKSGDNNGNVIGRCFPPCVSLKVIGGSGKVIFKFRCYKVEEVKFIMDYSYGGYYKTNSYVNEKCFERDCCLTLKELDNYINKNNLYKRDNVAYALHISNLEIFDKPKELSEFKAIKNCYKCWHSINKQNCLNCETLTKAPQNFCYIEGE